MVRRRFCMALGAALSLEVLVLVAGCSGSGSSGAAAPTLAQQTERRIEGQWRLERFDPEQALEPVLQTLLEFQYQALVINIQGGRIIADSPGVHFDRRYEVQEVRGDDFRAVSYDEKGVPYESWCRISPDGMTLFMQLQTNPWRGAATLKRLSAGGAP